MFAIKKSKYGNFRCDHSIQKFLLVPSVDRMAIWPPNNGKTKAIKSFAISKLINSLDSLYESSDERKNIKASSLLLNLLETVERKQKPEENNKKTSSC